MARISLAVTKAGDIFINQNVTPLFGEYHLDLRHSDSDTAFYRTVIMVPLLLILVSLHVNAIAAQLESRGLGQSSGIKTSTASIDWNSSILYPGLDGQLIYHSDHEDNRIPDFSHAGYHGGGIALPDVPVRVMVEPNTNADDSKVIQAAIDSVGAMEMDEYGVRGAVKLAPGNYYLAEQLSIPYSGVVLRGSGDGEDPANNTVIVAGKDIGHHAILVGTGQVDWSIASGSPLSEIISDFVPVGARSFDIKDPSGFKIDDDVILFHRATQEWIEAVDYGGRPLEAPNPWRAGDAGLHIMKRRTITGISGNTVSIDVPVYNHLDASLSIAILYKPDFSNMITESGVENFRLILENDGPEANDHVRDGIVFNGTEHCWVQDITVLHFRLAGVRLTNASFVTVKNSRALAPHSPIDGGYRYNFMVSARTGNILFSNNKATEGRHCYVSNGTASASGIVFLDSESYGAYALSEGHRRWSQGLLFDNLTFRDANRQDVLGLYNRGDYGTRHGWSAAHSVVWNTDAGPNHSIIIQKPPTAQNYGIGNQGKVTGDGPWEGPDGFIEGTGKVPNPSSLYRAQLQERLDLGVPPDSPAKLRVKSMDDKFDALKLTWLHHSVIPVELVIQRAENKSDSFKEIGRISSTKDYFIDENISSDNYHYRIRAVDENRISGWSRMVSFNSSISSFQLRNPADGSEHLLEGDPGQTIPFWWNHFETDFKVTYEWLLDKPENDFSDPLAVRTTEERLVQLSYEELDELLERMGVKKNEAMDLSWKVKAGVADTMVLSEQQFGIRLVRGKWDTSSNNEQNEIANHPKLFPAYPNPFNYQTTLSFSLPERGQAKLIIYDSAGRKVNQPVNRIMDPGMHKVIWDAEGMASGVYFIRLQISSNKIMTRPVTLVK